MRVSLCLVLIGWINTVRSTIASRGDATDPYFKNSLSKCVEACKSTATDSAGFWAHGDSVTFESLKAALKSTESSIHLEFSEFTFFEILFLWNCESDCRYKSMWVAVEKHQERGYFMRPHIPPIQQYYGKWPFFRVLGMQEFARYITFLFFAI